MDHYRRPEIDELVWNQSFRQWVLSPTPELDQFWTRYAQENPHAAGFIPQAREIVLALRVRNREISDAEVQQLVGDTLRMIQTEEPVETKPTPRTYRWIWAAASILLLVGLGWGLFFLRRQETSPLTYRQMVQARKGTLTERINTTGRPLRVQLPDGSRVTLENNSRISYAPHFEGQQRAVYLSGQAFFEVEKDPARPFVVFANELVTKVLGTSFTVRAYEQDHDFSVEVRTGRVSVYAAADLDIEKKVTRRELDGVVLTPNQKIVFSRGSDRIVKSLVDQPRITEKSQVVFRFEDAPVAQAFSALEKAYSVDIVFDEELMRNCPITASLADESLFEKLEIICKAIEARYEVIDGQIVIEAKGCTH